MDPRRWDLHQLLSAYEVTLQQGSKDDAAWKRTRAKLYEEPKEVRRKRLDGKTTPARTAMTLSGVEAMLAGAAARDAQFGAA